MSGIDSGIQLSPHPALKFLHGKPRRKSWLQHWLTKWHKYLLRVRQPHQMSSPCIGPASLFQWLISRVFCKGEAQLLERRDRGIQELGTWKNSSAAVKGARWLMLQSLKLSNYCDSLQSLWHIYRRPGAIKGYAGWATCQGNPGLVLPGACQAFAALGCSLEARGHSKVPG